MRLNSWPKLINPSTLETGEQTSYLWSHEVTLMIKFVSPCDSLTSEVIQNYLLNPAIEIYQGQYEKPIEYDAFPAGCFNEV